MFLHRDHISSIPATFAAIWEKGLPEAGLKVADALCLELYDARFHPRTGEGEVEIWNPIE